MHLTLPNILKISSLSGRFASQFGGATSDNSQPKHLFRDLEMGESNLQNFVMKEAERQLQTPEV